MVIDHLLTGMVLQANPPTQPDTYISNVSGPSDLLRQNFFGGRALHVASISENPEVTRCRLDELDVGWVGYWFCSEFQGIRFKSTYLEDHPRTCKRLITMVSLSPLSRVVPLISGLAGLNNLLSGVILQVKVLNFQRYPPKKKTT